MYRAWGKYLIELVIHIFFWIGMYYALRAITMSSFKMLPGDKGKLSGPMSINILFPYAKLVLGFLIMLFYSNVYGLFVRVIKYKNKIFSVAVISGWTLLLFGLDFWIVRGRIGSSGPDRTRPGIPPGGGFSGIDWVDMQWIIALVFLSVLGIAIAFFFIREWVRNNLARSRAESNLLSTEIKFLRSQVNPHFLFNTLNNLFSLAQKKGNNELADGISKLSGMMRYMLYESNTESVLLQKEIEYLRDCIALNKLRYADSEVAVTFNYPEQAVTAGVQIAPMLFVHFLDNAYKHGISIGQQSCIDMTIKLQQKKLIFVCGNTDYSTVKKMKEEQGGIGLENAKRRLQLLYPGRHELQIEKKENKFNVNLQIDLA
ncbi:MAG: histidine kinase [Chitinophagaceae bacterium]